MGWREALEEAGFEVSCATLAPSRLAQVLLELLPADRIALARELLEGTGRVVAREVLPDDLIPLIHEGLGGNGWAYSNYAGDELRTERDGLKRAANACRAAMLSDP